MLEMRKKVPKAGIIVSESGKKEAERWYFCVHAGMTMRARGIKRDRATARAAIFFSVLAFRET
jgi:hypothetical protein